MYKRETNLIIDIKRLTQLFTVTMFSNNCLNIAFFILSLSPTSYTKVQHSLIQPWTSSVRPNTRIVHGHKARQGQFPHQVCLLNRRATNEWSLCGGSIISNDYILTCAHCVRE